MKKLLTVLLMISMLTAVIAIPQVSAYEPEIWLEFNYSEDLLELRQGRGLRYFYLEAYLDYGVYDIVRWSVIEPEGEPWLVGFEEDETIDEYDDWWMMNALIINTNYLTVGEKLSVTVKVEVAGYEATAFDTLTINFSVLPPQDYEERVFTVDQFKGFVDSVPPQRLQYLRNVDDRNYTRISMYITNFTYNKTKLNFKNNFEDIFGVYSYDGYLGGGII